MFICVSSLSRVSIYVIVFCYMFMCVGCFGLVVSTQCSFGARAFAIAGPTVWNSLPDSLRDPAVGPDQFRRDLKTHLFV